MKRHLAILIGCCHLLWATSVSALSPVSSHYVQEVLDRADKGISDAGSAGGSSGVASSWFNWLDTVASAVLSLADTELRIEKQHRDLLENSACLRVDLFLIEEKMDEVREKLQAALQGGGSQEIYSLQSVLHFLNSRYGHLLRGARDPYYEDKGWPRRWSFDEDPIWCCKPADETCEQVNMEECKPFEGRASITQRGCELNGCIISDKDDDDRMCPFHSDYLPPTVAGYGCDTTILSGLSEHEASKAEHEALRTLLEERDAFLNQGNYLYEIWRAIMEFIYGTLEQAGLEDVAEALKNFLAALNTEHRTSYGCEGKEGDAPISESEKELKRLPEGAISWELRGPFSISKNEVKILPEFFELKRELGEAREQADYMKLPSELPKEEQEEAAKIEGVIDLFKVVVRRYARSHFSDWNTEQGGMESRQVAKAIDSHKQIKEEFLLIRPSMKTFSELASAPPSKGEDEEKGLRGFVRNFAYFIRRSCIFRPCNKRLDQVLKIIFEDKCFPYTKEGKGDYEECKKAAGINVNP